jgi:hypothetical protein
VPEDFLTQSLVDQGYIPIASEAELIAMATPGNQTFGALTPYEDSYNNPGLENNPKFVLVNDIALTSNWDTLGLGSYFNGTLHGNGFTISNLTFNENTTSVGLFATISGASITSLKFDDVTISSMTNIDHFGVLAGVATGAFVTLDQITLSNATLSFNQVDYAGGLIGLAYTTLNSDRISIHTIDITVNGSSSVVDESIGGFIGEYIYTGKTFESRSTINETAINNIHITNFDADHVGGVIGRVSNLPDSDQLVIKNLYSNGTVSAINAATKLGGLIGVIENVRSSTFYLELSYGYSLITNSGITTYGYFAHDATYTALDQLYIIDTASFTERVVNLINTTAAFTNQAAINDFSRYDGLSSLDYRSIWRTLPMTNYPYVQFVWQNQE